LTTEELIAKLRKQKTRTEVSYYQAIDLGLGSEVKRLWRKYCALSKRIIELERAKK